VRFNIQVRVSIDFIIDGLAVSRVREEEKRMDLQKIVWLAGYKYNEI